MLTVAGHLQPEPEDPDAFLADAYEEAWDEWDSNGEAQVWETALTDGLLPETVD